MNVCVVTHGWVASVRAVAFTLFVGMPTGHRRRRIVMILRRSTVQVADERLRSLIMTDDGRLLKSPACEIDCPSR